uniref:Indole-3-acetaldehyde oxidase n=2 Tax=Clastoptera arizonana TaxID=38151 RepID=A0A1B6CM27_9HEMI
MEVNTIGDSQSANPKEVVFSINKKIYKVSENVPITTSLSKYIRDFAHLYGTKNMCNEGGCGSCIVKVQKIDVDTKKDVFMSLNSCLIPVFACHGWSITTIEGLGDKIIGYDEIQLRLAQYNGTQCGFCSPGMVMNMSSLLDSEKVVHEGDIDKSFDGNICRCTGYRSILAAFKTFAEDAKPQDKNEFCDIEELFHTCSLQKKSCTGGCTNNYSIKKIKSVKETNADLNPLLFTKPMYMKSQDINWFRVTSKNEIFDIWKQIGDEPYVLVAGNTAQGVYESETPVKNNIDINNVSELKGYIVTNKSLTIGSNVTLACLIDIFETVANKNQSEYGYLSKLADHVGLVANVPVRNMATVAGNLCIKHKNKEFPSDIFVILETVGAKLVLEKADASQKVVSLIEFLNTELSKTLITRVILPPLDQKLYELRTYKIMPRARSAHAYVNAGFLLLIDKENNFRIKGQPNIIYGGINSNFVHAINTEQYFSEQGQQGKSYLDESVLESALEILSHEIDPSHDVPEASPEYRAGLATSLLYKCILGLSPLLLNPKYISGGEPLTRPTVSKGTVNFNTDKSLWPVNKPVSKIEALYQCSGEAQYINDIPCLPNELHGALVLTTVAGGEIVTIDPSEALAIPGIVAFFSAKDIPGKNNFTPFEDGATEEEVLFCDGKVLYYGQPLGIIVGDSQEIALKAAHKVSVTYSKPSDNPVLDIKDIVSRNDESKIFLQSEILPIEEDTDAHNEHPIVCVSGKCELQGQYHFTMELQTCICVPVEDGFDLYSSTQWMQNVQDAVSNVLNVPSHCINMKIRRVGGGYGSKLTRSSMVASACAVASKCLNRPVRLVLSLETNMAAIGKRYPCYTEYHAKVNANTGKILELEAKLYEDAGCSLNDRVVHDSLFFMKQTYNSDNWTIKGYAVKTDHASNTWCRSPGSTEGIATIEGIIEGIATAISFDPLKLRLVNLKSENSQLPEMIDYWIKHTDYEERMNSIEEFNEQNFWKQRGLSLVPMAYCLRYVSMYNAMVTIYAFDGTVAVTHGGIECGQGINTKVAQVCAHTLGIDMSFIQIKPSDNLTSPNNQSTGGSVTSETACYAVMMCCKELMERLQPFKSDLIQDEGWPDLVKKAYAAQTNLNATYMFTLNDPVKNYYIYGVTAVEVEVDILTGQHIVTRADILEDAGVSLSPQIDIGQIEGAFVMGLGYYTTEQLIYDITGELKTNRTWNYYPPGAQDIPVDFRVEIQKNSENPSGVLRSKATGEPPLCMSVAVVLAIQKAFSKTRHRNGTIRYVNFSAPMTPEKTFLSCRNDIKYYKLTT